MPSNEGGDMPRTPQDVTDAELAVLQALWDGGPADRRRLAEALYPGGGPASYTTVQKLLERLQAKGSVCRRPAVRHGLWLLVLLKLVTPPLYGIPVPLPAAADESAGVPMPPSPPDDPPPLPEPVAAASPGPAISVSPPSPAVESSPAP